MYIHFLSGSVLYSYMRRSILLENFLNYKFVFDINKEDKYFLKKNIKTHLNNINNYGLKNSIININNSKL